MVDLIKMLQDRYGLYIAKKDDYLNETIRGLLTRRVCRSFLDREIDDELLDVLLACAQSAPTKSNLQQYSIVTVRNKETRKKIAGLIPSMQWIAKAPVFLTFLGDVRRNRKLANFRGHNYANNNADTFMNAAIDAALAMQMFINAAESAGLGCCPISYVRNCMEEFAVILNLPDGVFPIAGLPLGWPARDGFVSMRLPQNIIVHREQYWEDALEVEVDAYDERNHERSPLSPKNQRHTDNYGVLEKCTWSENVARQLSLPERQSFASWLKSRGIDLT